MANGIPVRLSESLAARARAVAAVQDRSMTEQVEHWARLGQVLETVVSTETVAVLKAHSHDPDLRSRLAAAHSPQARAETARFLEVRNPIRYGVNAKGRIVKAKKRRTAKR